MEYPKTPEEFCRYLWQQYLVERRCDILQEVVAPEISVIGTGAHETSRNGRIHLRHGARERGVEVYQTTRLSRELDLVIGELMAKDDSDGGILYDVRFRFSRLLRKRGESWKIVHFRKRLSAVSEEMSLWFIGRIHRIRPDWSSF